MKKYRIIVHNADFIPCVEYMIEGARIAANTMHVYRVKWEGRVGREVRFACNCDAFVSAFNTHLSNYNLKAEQYI